MKKILLFIFITITFLHANSFDNGMKYFKKGNYHKAMPFFMKASKAGNKEAQFYLANMFEKGLGVRKDPKMASKLYKLYTSKSVEKITTTDIPKRKKTIRTKKNQVKKVVKKVRKTKQVKKKKYSKRLNKNYNPEIKAPKEVIFN